MKIVNKFSGFILLPVGSILLVGFIIDTIISFDAMFKINNFLNNAKSIYKHF